MDVRFPDGVEDLCPQMQEDDKEQTMARIIKHHQTTSLPNIGRAKDWQPAMHQLAGTQPSQPIHLHLHDQPGLD